MPAQVTTRAQVNGYRFLIRRLEHALIRGDSRMIHDPMRGQMRALLVGLFVAVLVTGACAVLAFFKPAPNFGGATIFLSKSSGGLFVRIGDRLHPALNLASARLIVGKNDNPKEVDDKFLDALPRGSMVGIVGAPTSIRGGAGTATPSWTVCDTLRVPAVTEPTGATTIDSTVLVTSPVLDGDIRTPDPTQAVLADVDGISYLIYDGVRAPIDLSNPAVLNGLHLQGAPTRRVSRALLNAFPMVEAIGPVSIDGIGEPSAALGPGYPVGAIVKSVDSRGEQRYVVLREGLQPISAATADIIRYGEPNTAEVSVRDAREIAPALVAAAPVVHRLPVDHYPAVSPQILPVDPDRVVCMAWQRTNTAMPSTIRLLAGHRLPMPDGAQTVQLAGSSGDGTRADDVYLRPGSGEYVQATGAEPDSHSSGQLYYVSDTGVRYHVKDSQTADALGLTGVTTPHAPANAPRLAPWPVLSLLPPGPDLSQEAALVAHDGIAADAHSAKIQPPSH